jgi:hypothetical protein
LWRKCKVHPDHHVVFDRSYYSVPTRYIGQEVWVRGGADWVRIFQEGQLIKTHRRAGLPGTWRTDYTDYPPEKIAYLMPAPTMCRKKAEEVGPKTRELIEAILGDHAMRNLRKAQAILRLAEKHGWESMEAAAERALFFGNHGYHSLKKILEQGWRVNPETAQLPLHLSPLGQRFLRPPDYFGLPKEVAS